MILINELRADFLLIIRLSTTATYLLSCYRNDSFKNCISAPVWVAFLRRFRDLATFVNPIYDVLI